MKSCVALVVLAGCKGILGIESGVVADANGSDAPLDEAPGNDAPTIDARTCFGTYEQVCLTQLPTIPMTVTSTTLLDTTACPDPRTIDGVDVCIWSATRIDVMTGGRLETAGPRFAVLVATEEISIAGTLDSWVAGTTTGCMTAQGGIQGGGAGGSFGTLGGMGGGAQGTVPNPAPTTIDTFRRGCPGDEGGSNALGGDGGLGGSGIFLIAPSIRIANGARINASGDGGGGGTNDRGGGGGGSGGLVVFDSDTLEIETNTVVLAVGGGGGGGGGAGLAMAGTRANPNVHPMRGVGGMGDCGPCGSGGDGGTTSTGVMGDLGTNGRGSGGGGGGTGVIIVTATAPTITGTVTPSARAP